MVLHYYLISHYIDKQQKENYYNSYNNYIRNEKLRDLMLPNLGVALQSLYFQNDDKK